MNPIGCKLTSLLAPFAFAIAVLAEESHQRFELIDAKNFELLIQDIMLKTLVPYQCVTIITDKIYDDVFQPTWYERFHGLISFFKIQFYDEDNEFLFQNGTEQSLTMAKNDGCQMYVILVADGEQVAELLKFGDRGRLFDTKSKYVLLYNTQLFEKHLFYIWGRLINVVFIRRNKPKKPGNGSKKSPWYELSTVPFPFYFKDVLVPIRLDIWAQSKFRKAAELFKDKTFDLKNQTLKVTALAHIPGTLKISGDDIGMKAANRATFRTSSPSDTNASFRGTEIEIVEAISNAMNFRCALYEPSEMATDGDVGGNFTGLLGEMTSAVADIALGDLYYIPYVLDYMDLSVPYYTQCLTFLTPESSTDISWKTLVLPFSGVMWATVLVCLLLISYVFHALAGFHVHINKVKEKCRKNGKVPNNVRKTPINFALEPQIFKFGIDTKYTLMMEQYQPVKEENEPEGLYQFSEPVNSVLYTYSMLLLVSLPKLPTGWSLRMLTGWYWLYCLLLVVAYRASMTAILSRPAPRVTIDTLDQLTTNKLRYGCWSEINRIFFKSSSDSVLRVIGEQFELVASSDEAVDKVSHGNFAFYENIYFLKEALAKRQQRYQEAVLGNKTNQSRNAIDDVIKSVRNLHIMRNCVFNLPVSIGLQKNSPIKFRVDKLVRRVVEAGLIEKWVIDVMQEVMNGNVQDDDMKNAKALMNLKKFSGALVVLGVGCIFSSFTLLAELIYHRYVIERNPHYNKYSKTIVAVKKAH
ncbi:uncharacterized protein LOC132704046 isoform X2 [Cylas formicarius]|uniref:uncharacterized protein LOC132704046 isoform X2 n=1 Tax=Cylas formicarius TaxID=197179 RepID=UPI00295868F1|nr:uncharacterized protein LOC132704046 isoform X2 [Cylas formicarius]